jgi:hypothetical protein
MRQRRETIVSRTLLGRGCCAEVHWGQDVLRAIVTKLHHLMQLASDHSVVEKYWNSVDPDVRAHSPSSPASQSRVHLPQWCSRSYDAQNGLIELKVKEGT